MSEKCCGNCRYFKDEDAVGWGRCVGHMTEFGVHCSLIGCPEHKFVKNAINGWIELTPDNVDEIDAIDPNRVVIATMIEGIVFSSVRADSDITLKSCSELGGYYCYVLPELKIE